MVASTVPFAYQLPERSSVLRSAVLPHLDADSEVCSFWEREALILFSTSDTIYAFLGPFKPTPATKLFDSSSSPPILAFRDTLPLSFLDKLSGVFNATPPSIPFLAGPH